MTTADTLRLLETRIKENAARYFPRLAGHHVTARFTRLAVGSNQLYLCELDPGDGAPSASIIVKIAPKPSLHEFAHLTLLHENRGDAPRALVVPRPLDFFADINALLTEKIGGTQLSTLVVRDLHVLAGRRRRESIAARVRLCGQWLAHYHRLTRCPDAAPFNDDWLKRVSRTVEELEGAGFPKPTLDAAWKRLSRLNEVGRHHLAPYAHRHGDFGLRNVHAGDDWVCVFDLNDRRPECVYEDISHFIITLETMNTWPRHPFFDRRAATGLRSPLLTGYFGPDRRCSPFLLEAHILKHLLLHCARQRRHLARRSRWVLPIFDALRFRRLYPQRILRQCESVDRLLRET